MVLREATAPDAGVLCDAWFAMLQETKALIEPVATNWRTTLHDHFVAEIARGRHHWRVVEVDRRIVATGALFLLVDPAIGALSGMTGTIAGIYTQPAHRRQGLARMILGDLLALALSKKCHSVRLRASDAGRPLYEQYGFRPADEMFLQLA